MKRTRGSTLTSFLEEEGIKDEVDLLTFKKVLADEIESRMTKRHVSAAELARRMDTSRSQVYRLLSEQDTGVTLMTISHAAQALECSLIDLIASVSRKAKHDERL